MFDAHSTRAAAVRWHMPIMLLAWLAVSVALVGDGGGVAGRCNIVLATAMAFLISGTPWAIIAMDHPSKGLIRVGQQPMLELRRSLNSELTQTAAQPAH